MVVLSYHAFIYLNCMYDWFCFICTMICTIHSLVPYHICEIHTDNLHEHVYFHLMRVCETYVDRLHVKIHFHAIHVHTCICVLYIYICGYLNASQSNNPPPLRFGAPPNKLPATQQQQPQMQQRKRQQVSK